MTAKPKGKNSRRYKRISTRVRVDFTPVSLQEEVLGLEKTIAYASNFSHGGLGLETDVITKPIYNYLNKENVDLKLEIFLPFQKEPIQSVGKVIWFWKLAESKFKIGVEFKSIKKEDLKSLKRFVYGIKYSVDFAVVSLVVGLILILFYFYWMAFVN